MNIFLKSKNFLFSFKLPKAKSLLNSFNLVYTYQYKFSEKISRKKCSHLKSDFYNLLLVSKKSEENILNTIEKYPDINYICFLMQMVLELQFATPYLVEPLTTKFLQVELNNPTNLMNLYRGLPKASPPLMSKVIDHIQISLLKMLPFLQESNLKEVIELTKLLPNPSHNQIIDKINTYLSLTSEEKTKLYLKTLKLDELIESEKNFWEFLKIDLENKEFRLIHKETQQEIIICGSDGYPCESLNHVLNLIEKEKNEINLLIVQDAPILDKKGDSAESLDRKSSKTLVKFFKKKGYQDELQGDILEFYVKSFINNEFFVLDLKQRKVFQKLNNYFFIPSDLGTSIVNFILNSNSEKKSKVILSEFPSFFQIASSVLNNSIDHCRDLLNICNYVNLLEKTFYSQYTYHMGCYKCSPAEETDNSYLPRDYISILMGDILFPSREKTDYLSKKIYKAIKINPEYKKILVLVNSSFLRDVLKNIFVFSQQIRLGSIENFSEMATLKKYLDVFKEVDKNSDIMEKTVILEILYATFCMDMTNLKKQDPRINLSLQKYIDYHKHFSQIFSYETLMDQIGEHNLFIESDEEDEKKTKIEICPANALIFGGADSKPLIKKFYLNPIFKKHFGGSEEEIEEMKKIYELINEKTEFKKNNKKNDGDDNSEDEEEEISSSEEKRRKKEEKDKKKKKKKVGRKKM